MATTETVLIDKLLHAVVRQGASDLHITVGQPPVIRHDGHMVKLKTKVLEPSDTMSLMKSITPDRCQQELQAVGGSDFGFAFGELARFRVSVFKQRGNIAMVLRQIPAKLLTMEQLGLPQACVRLIQRPRGLFLVTGPTGSGKTTTLASMINYLNENFDHHIITIEDPIEFYHHQQEVDGQPARDRRRRAQFFRGAAACLASGSRRDPGGRDARPGHDRSGHHRGRNGPRRVRHAAHDRRPGHGQPHHRRLSDQPAGPDPHAAFHVDHRRAFAGADPQDRRRARARPTRCWCARSAIANLIRENKTFRITSAIQTGAKHGMLLLDDSLFQLWREQKCAKADVMAKAQMPDELAARIANAERGMFDEEDDPKNRSKDDH